VLFLLPEKGCANSTDREALEEKQTIAQVLVDRVTVNREAKVTIQLAIPEAMGEPKLGALPPTLS